MEEVGQMDAEGEALRDLGHETDMNEGRIPTQDQSAEQPESRATGEADTPPPQEPQPDETVESEQTPGSSETETRQQPQPPKQDPVTGRFVKQKPETDYSRAQKEQARKDRSWQALQAEKEQFRRQQGQWEENQRVQQLAAYRRKCQPLRRDGLTAQEYYQGALVFEKEGDYENAFKAHRMAQEMFQAEQSRTTQRQAVEAEYQWRVGMQEAIKANPEIGDPNSPISDHLARIIQDNP